jgi:hypothetical protein
MVDICLNDSSGRFTRGRSDHRPNCRTNDGGRFVSDQVIALTYLSRKIMIIIIIIIPKHYKHYCYHSFLLSYDPHDSHDLL